MFSFLVNGKEKDTKDVFYNAEPTPVVDEETLNKFQEEQQRRIDNEDEEGDNFEHNEQLIKIMKSNDGKWLDQLASKLNSSDDDEELEEDYSDDDEDMYGVERDDGDDDNNNNNNDNNDSDDNEDDNNKKDSSDSDNSDSDVPPKYPIDRTIFVRSLNFDTTEESLKKFFKDNDVGIEQCILEKNNSGRSAGFAYVVFNDASIMTQAMKIYDGATLDGRAIQFSEYDPKLSYRRSGKRKKKKKKKLVEGEEIQKQRGNQRKGFKRRRNNKYEKNDNNNKFRKNNNFNNSRGVRGRGRGRGGSRGGRGRGRGRSGSRGGRGRGRGRGSSRGGGRGRGRGSSSNKKNAVGNQFL